MNFNYFDIDGVDNAEMNRIVYSRRLGKTFIMDMANIRIINKKRGKMWFEFGKLSKQYLAGVEPRLVELMKAVLKESGIKFVITCGIRTAEEQQRLYKEKKSNCDGVNHKSKHQANFRGLSEAVDIAVIDLTDKRKITWDIKYYYYIAGIFEAKAKAMGIKARWGGWFRGLEDGGHFELMD